jgi:2-polyprenyl-3-methyl-5-hydroxy-6-metoxy-1,4-benzoquinol methylase
MAWLGMTARAPARAVAVEAANQLERVRAHYGAWASTYGDSADDGWFAHVRAREHRIVSKMMALRGGESILDAGCGPGLYAGALKEGGHEVVALDISPEMIERVKGKVDQALVGDVQTLRLGRTFDRVVCLGVMEYVTDAAATFRRLSEHVAPGGLLVTLVPRSGPGGWIYRELKRRAGLATQLYTPARFRGLGESVGLSFIGLRTPFIHNFVMAFRCDRTP